MIIIKFNDSNPDKHLSPLSFPITIINEDGTEYQIIRSDEKKISAIKPK